MWIIIYLLIVPMLAGLLVYAQFVVARSYDYLFDGERIDAPFIMAWCAAVIPIAVLLYVFVNYVRLRKQTSVRLQELEITRVETEQFMVLGRLSASIAHEVRNPLNNILLLVDELDRSADAPDVIADICRRLRSNSGRIDHAVQLVYRLARPGEVRHRLESNDFGDLIILFDSIKENMESQSGRIIVTNKTGKKRVLMSGDYDCLQTIFENLLRNASLASHDTPVYVDIEEVNEGASIRVVIYNEGVLPESFKIATIEDLSSRTAKVHGLGLGVVIVNELAKQLRMRISYNSDGQVVSFEVVGAGHRGIFDPIEDIDEKDEFNDGSVPRIDC